MIIYSGTQVLNIGKLLGKRNKSLWNSKSFAMVYFDSSYLNPVAILQLGVSGIRIMLSNVRLSCFSGINIT